jgi:hypothetical protein
VSLCVACSSSGGDGGNPADADQGGDTTDAAHDVPSPSDASDASDARATDASDASSDAAEVATDAPADVADAGPSSATIYASSNTTLFTFDPATKSLKTVGDFDCIGGVGQDTAMTDIAVDAAGTVYGVSAHDAYTLDLSGAVAHCAKTVALSAGRTFYGLSMAPAGVIGSAETLIAASTAGELWTIDLGSGALTEHGTFGTVPANDGRGHAYAFSGGAWELSGDVVFGVGAGGSTVAFATVRDCPTPPSSAGCDAVDTLAEIDVAALAAPGTATVLKSIRGQIVRGAACSDTATGYGAFYGLAMTADRAIGFDHTGGVVSIDFTTGEGCVLLRGTTIFGGAGVTDAVVTSAP